MVNNNPSQDDAVENRPIHSDDQAILRNTLRHERIAAREALSPSEHDRRSRAIEAHLATLLAQCSPHVLGFCWPFRAEFDCRPLAIRQLERGVSCCLPLVTAPDAVLEFRTWQPQSEMLIDRYGIHYPASGELLVPDVLLIPVNAFDESGYRLGYGAGYFDRTLISLSPAPIAIGIGFELARADSIYPQRHDMPLDAVVTETGIRIFSERLRAIALAKPA